MARQFVTKYELAFVDAQLLHMSTEAVLLGVHYFNGKPHLFCQEEAAPLNTRDLAVFLVSAAGEVPLAAVDYIGTTTFGDAVTHVYTE